MIELLPEEFRLIAPAFTTTSYGALAAGTLEGGHPGRVFVDRRENAQAGLVCTRVGYNFLAGQPSAELADQIAALFSADLIQNQQVSSQNPEFLLFYDPPGWAPLLLRSLQERRPLLIYKKRHILPHGAEQALRGWQTRLPSGMRAAVLDQELLKSHPELKETADLFYSSAAVFLQRGLGVCLLEGEELACVCRTVFTGAGEAEIDIYTVEAYRRRGLAYLAASAFIETCLARGWQPVWGCWPENAPSLSLARRLGFIEESDQAVCLWVDEPEWNNGDGG